MFILLLCGWAPNLLDNLAQYKVDSMSPTALINSGKALYTPEPPELPPPPRWRVSDDVGMIKTHVVASPMLLKQDSMVWFETEERGLLVAFNIENRDNWVVYWHKI